MAGRKGREQNGSAAPALNRPGADMWNYLSIGTFLLRILVSLSRCLKTTALTLLMSYLVILNISSFQSSKETVTDKIGTPSFPF